MRRAVFAGERDGMASAGDASGDGPKSDDRSRTSACSAAIDNEGVQISEELASQHPEGNPTTTTIGHR